MVLGLSKNEEWRTLTELRKLDNESFMIPVTEAVRMINLRPLTFLPVDSEKHRCR